MYKHTRQEAADILSMSTRSIDRYIKSGKLRSKKVGKIIYIHSQDIENLGSFDEISKAEVILPQEKAQYFEKKKQQETIHTEEKSAVSKNTSATLEKIYLDLRSEIKQKDITIQELSLKLWQAQEIAKNSVSVIEFKKSQLLLEESKNHISEELHELKEKNGELVQKLKYEKSTNYILISLFVVLFIGIGLIWFLNI